MAQHLISLEEAEKNFLDAAAYVAESIPPGESHAAAIAAVVPHYLENGNVDLAAELANSVDDPFTRDRLLIAVAANVLRSTMTNMRFNWLKPSKTRALRHRGTNRSGSQRRTRGNLKRQATLPR